MAQGVNALFHQNQEKIIFNMLQGSLRRKIEGQPPGFNPKQNGLSAGAFGPDLKRIRVEGGTMGHSGCAFSNGAQSHSLPEGAQMSHSLQRKDGNLMGPPPMGGDLFSLTLKEMKKEPGEVHSCGQSQASSAIDPAMMVFEFKEEEGDGQIDPELQDLFDELTKTVPSLNDLEFEKILKQDEEAAFGLDLGRPSSVGPAQPFAQLERAIKSEFSPSGFGHTPASSPQLRPASAGPALSMPPTSSSSPSATAIQNPGQGSLGSSLSSGGVPPGGRTNALTSWAEVSHAEQLKQIAANQQQQQPPAANLLQHHQHQHQQNQNQPATQAGWSPAHSSPGTISSPAGLCQSSILPPMSSAQGKGLNSCLFKTNGGGVGGVTISGVSISGVSSASCSSGSSMDMKALGSKPLSHFSHKPQQVGLMGAPQSKPAALRFQQPLKQPQGATPLPNQRQPPQHFHSPTLPPCQQPKSLPLNQKMPLNQHGPGLHFKLQQRQCTSGEMGESGAARKVPVSFSTRLSGLDACEGLRCPQALAKSAVSVGAPLP
ncbi:hypothetical protein AGOR_G00030920 [Albula goreensis]|uniref:Uncharacterized protein n=1 Tax=Albula goreensis TaxID=1534307 RepID=A0A8T3EA18_9TELE|nr:hypothetical protein AGOR_G00030920 [Albula goreensis]